MKKIIIGLILLAAASSFAATGEPNTQTSNLTRAELQALDSSDVYTEILFDIAAVFNDNSKIYYTHIEPVNYASVIKYSHTHLKVIGIPYGQDEYYNAVYNDLKTYFGEVLTLSKEEFIERVDSECDEVQFPSHTQNRHYQTVGCFSGIIANEYM